MYSVALFRLSGLALLIALPLQVLGFVLHPPSEEVVDVLESAYGPAHLILFVSWIFALLGLTGFYALGAPGRGAGPDRLCRHHVRRGVPFLSAAVRGVRDARARPGPHDAGPDRKRTAGPRGRGARSFRFRLHPGLSAVRSCDRARRRPAV